MNEFSRVGYPCHLKVESVPTHRQGCGVGVEDVKTELLEGLLEDNVHHGVLLPIFCFQVIDLHLGDPSTSMSYIDRNNNSNDNVIMITGSLKMSLKVTMRIVI